MCVSGAPASTLFHAKRIARLALSMMDIMGDIKMSGSTVKVGTYELKKRSPIEFNKVFFWSVNDRDKFRRSRSRSNWPTDASLLFIR